jgi:subfamily B ATP-binding cassette protein MsbA
MFSLGSLKSLKPYLWPHKNWLFFSLFMAIPLSALRAAPVPLLKHFIDEVLVQKDSSKLLYFSAAVVGLYLLNLPVRFFHYYAIRIVVVNTNQRIREKLYEHLLSLSADYFSDKKAGSLISRLTADPANLDNGIASFNVLIREPITFIVLLGYTLYTNWKLTILTFLIAPALAIVFGKSGKYIKSKIREYQVQNGESYGVVQEGVSGIRVIHLFNLESAILTRYSKQMSEITRTLLKISKMEELAGPTVELVTSFATAFIFYFGGRAVLKDGMSAGDFIAFFTAFGLMINPIRQISDINAKLHTAAAAMERIDEFLAWKPRVASQPNATPIRTISKGIEFKNINFTYPDSPERSVLKDVSFRLPIGKTVALVGQSGSGKSSIVQLLTRLYDVNQGSIEIDGMDLRTIDLKTWRNQVAVVSQDVFLFHDTIFQNILMGRPKATRDEVIEAAQKAHAYDFIMRLPQGFETMVGDRGMKLSGGERQRISIARAFLKNSPCLILDEATSNLDNESEKMVQQALEILMENRTTLVIAHRLSTIQNSDEIIVLKQGVIQEAGTYATLASKGGEFERLLSFAKSNS